MFELSWAYPGLEIVDSKEFGVLVKGYSVCGPKGVLTVI
nr:MAG TPA: hypothetical protein [Caudoviricetes sp.]